MARILIAEDDDIVAEVARDTLIDAGHAVGVLDNGKDALETIIARRPDLVILDCNMPELGGMLVLRELRKRADFMDMPVLILTARQSRKDSDVAFYEGADDYMTKPFDPDALAYRVELLLKGEQPSVIGR